MKHILILCTLILTSAMLYAQSPESGKQDTQKRVPALPLRQVSGIVKDSTEESIPGAIVKLESSKDTVTTTTNENGIFIFKNIKSATFVLSISSVGQKRAVKRYFNNDAIPKLVLDPVILKSESKELKEVVIKGTPSIIYKVDTIEYKAIDYKVDKYATVDELIKKMEGFEVAADGSVTHQGQQLTKAKLNGKEYAGGDMAQAIRNLPAEIVEKIQVVNDYGDQAARTGIKDGDAQKILNITTLADRSVGTTASITGKYGNNDRYNADLFIQHLDANQQLGLIGNLANTVTGIAPGGASSAGAKSDGSATGTDNLSGKTGGPGTTKSGNASFNYRDQLSQKLEVIASYNFHSAINDATNDSNGQRYSTNGSSNFTNHNTVTEDRKSHRVRGEINYNIDQNNYLQVTPSLTYTNTTNQSNSLTDNISNYTTGFEHPVMRAITNNIESSPVYGMTVFFQHLFTRPRRNFSLQYSILSTKSTQNGDKNASYQYYADASLNTLVQDSLSHLLIERHSNNTNYTTTATYVEPLGRFSQLEFTGKLRKAVYDNTAVSDTVLANETILELSRLNNIYHYSFSESRYAMDYRFNGTRFNLSAGALALPSTLSGNKVNNSGDGSRVAIVHNYFRVIPVFRFSYGFSATQRIELNYSGSNAEPQFQQLQPFTDRTDPNNLIVGNPDLKPTFTNTLNLIYNNYLSNSKLNFSFNIRAVDYSNQITNNIRQMTEVIENNGVITHKTINEITYVNVEGSHLITGTYNIAKQLSDRRYNLELNGAVTYNYRVAMSNDLLYHNTVWRFNERIGPRINPIDGIEVNPYIGYDLSRSFTTLPQALPTELQTTSIAVDGRFIFHNNLRLTYSMAKSYVKGLAELGNQSPLVINAGFEKRLLRRKNLTMTFNAYDLLHQNNFIQQTVTAQGITNTLSNTLSRYFLVGLNLKLQRWSGEPKRNGKTLPRRGDGSFIYE